MIRAFQTLGHEVEVVCLVHPETAQADAGRDATEAWWKTAIRGVPWGYEIVQLGYNLIGIPLLLAALIRRRPAFIYERYSLFNFSGMVAGWLLRVPVVLEVNSPLALEQKRDSEIRGYKFARWTERVICNSAARVIVVSSPLRRIMIEAGVRPEKLEVMPNGINLQDFRGRIDSRDLRAQLRLEGKTVIGFVGWFRNWHGLDTLLEAFHRAALGPSGGRLLLIGDGPEMASLQRYVRANALDEYVVFTGPLAHDRVPPHLNLIDIAVQPAANEYCCPMKILEYMAMGKPIVAPRQENIEEVIDDGRQGFFFTPGDVASMASALERLFADPDLAAAMGRRSLETITARGFLWTRNAERVVDWIVGSPDPQHVRSVAAP
jgi:glycosyltransferase involved in cell wall biosynthesis